MSHEINNELPFPPRSEPYPDAIHRSEDILLLLLDGRAITGQLIRYSPSEPTIKLLHSVEKNLSSINISEIKTVELNNSRQFVKADDKLSLVDNASPLPQDRQEYEITFIDEQHISGETLGHVSDLHGIHLFLPQAFNNYHHVFIPFSAIKTHRIGPMIGELLVDSKTISDDDLNQGLQEQNRLRGQRIGDILRAEHIISKEQLEATVNKQVATKGSKVRIGEALLKEGIITEAQLDKALEKQKEDRSQHLGQILIGMKLVKPADIVRTLAAKLGIPFVNLRKFDIDTQAVQMVPEKISRQHHVMPLCHINNKLIIAVEDPLNRLPMEDIRFHCKTFVEPVLADPEDIQWALDVNYGLKIDSLVGELDDQNESEFEEADQSVSESDNALVKLVNKMIIDAFQQGASDIHIEPYSGKKKTVIRFRKDGVLVPYVELAPSYRYALVSRIKIMCDLDISERRKPQDGKIDFKKFGPANIELRVATIPTAGGVEDVVLRVLANSEPIPLEQLEMTETNLNNVSNLIKKPYGLFLVCGPTGSGKTTTLHSILGRLNIPDRKIWTAEDPVEITQKGLRQLQVNPKIDLTFANAMRAFLRADPDIIMVGEMRDEETTAIGVEASLTGHLVLSTLHTNSAPESVVRLLDMGMDPYNFADAILGVLAQRLARRLCRYCKTPYEASSDELRELAREYFSELPEFHESESNLQAQYDTLIESWYKHYASDDGKIVLHKLNGCDECGQIGYSGRIALHELLVASDKIKHLIQDRARVRDILSQAYREDMRTLKQDGIEKIIKGETDIHQVHAVCIK